MLVQTLPTAGVGPRDPYFENVVLLLGYNDVFGSQNFVDDSNYGHVPSLTSAAAAQTDETQCFGNVIGIEPGGCLVYDDAPEFSFDDGDFTVETFFRFNLASSGALIVKWNGSAEHEWAFFVKPSLIEFYWSTTGSDQPSINYNPAANMNDFYHLAFSRVGDVGHLCFAGSIVKTVSMAGVNIRNGAGKIGIGRNNNGTTAQWAGWLDETRITKGVGRYAGAVGDTYPLPSAEFPRS